MKTLIGIAALATCFAALLAAGIVRFIRGGNY